MKDDFWFWWMIFLFTVMNAMMAYAVKELRRENPLSKMARVCFLIPPLGIVCAIWLVFIDGAKKAVLNYFKD